MNFVNQLKSLGFFFHKVEFCYSVGGKAKRKFFFFAFCRVDKITTFGKSQIFLWSGNNLLLFLNILSLNSSV